MKVNDDGRCIPALKGEVLAPCAASHNDEDAPESIEESLLDRFLTRKKKVVTKESSDYDSVDEFRRQVRTADNPKELLSEIYVNYLWIQNDEGDHFETEKASIDSIEAISDSEDLVREEVNKEFDILYAIPAD